MATARESVNYAAIYTNKYPTSKRKVGDGSRRLPIEITIVSASATGDTYKAQVIPAYATVTDAMLVTDGLSASGGVGIAVEMGDSGDVDRYIDGWDADVLNGSARLASAGALYTPTSDTVVLVTITGTAVVGKVIKGFIDIIPAG